MIAIHSPGEGRDLVMLPGWGMHRAMWGNLAQRLAQHARVHVCEPPGYADNEAQQMPSFEQFVDELAAAFSGKVTVLGWSLGGTLALSWARRYPQQVERLILLSTTPSFMAREDWPHGTSAAVMRNFSTSLQADPVAVMRNFFRLLVEGEAQREESLTQLRDLYATMPAASKQALVYGMELLRDTDLRAQLTQIGQPALLLHGENDAVTSVEAARSMATQLPDARIQTIARCGHAPHLTHADEIYHCIRDFLGD